MNKLKTKKTIIDTISKMEIDGIDINDIDINIYYSDSESLINIRLNFINKEIK